MTLDSKTFVATYLHAVEAFNGDDLQAFADLLADDCVFTATAGPVGSSRAEIIDRLAEGRAAGWTSHNLIGTFAGGEFLVGVFENRYADGAAVVSAGMMRFNPEGQVSEIRSMDPI